MIGEMAPKCARQRNTGGNNAACLSVHVQNVLPDLVSELLGGGEVILSLVNRLQVQQVAQDLLQVDGHHLRKEEEGGQ
jgi:hypothetical protein